MKKLAIGLILALSIGLTSCEPDTPQYNFEYFNKEYRDTSNNLYQVDEYSFVNINGGKLNIFKKRKLENYEVKNILIYSGTVIEKTIYGDTIEFKIEKTYPNLIPENINIKVIRINNKIVNIIE